MLAGIVNALIAAGLAAATTLHINLGLPYELGLADLCSALATGLVLILGGAKMLRFRSYYLALSGAALAILPTSPAWPISLFFGISALAQLASRATRREFDVERRRLEEFG